MKRPTSVTVFAILNMVFASMGICGLIYMAATYPLQQQGELNNLILNATKDNAAYQWFYWGSTGLGAVMTVVQFASGVGLWRLKPWGRSGAIVYGVYSIVMGIIAPVVNYFVMFRPLLEHVQQMQPGPERMGLVIGAFIVPISIVLSLIYPVLLLVFMYRPNVKAAFGLQTGVASEESPFAPPDDSATDSSNPYHSPRSDL